jgi:hypothetical protein
MIDPDQQDEQEPEAPTGRIAPTGPGPLVGFGVVGLVLGWAIRPFCLRFGYAEPQVSLLSIGLLLFVTAFIAGSAYLTRRVVRGNRLDLLPHQAVNRLVLGKACALAGAFLAGGYFGYALAQVGVADPVADLRMWRALAGGAVGIAMLVAALLLENACRIPTDED